MTIKTKWGNAYLRQDGYYEVVIRKALHHLIWEEHYGKSIPDGYVIHHKDGDRTNNEIFNLQCCEKTLHMRCHNTGTNNHQYNKHYRIVKYGFDRGKQVYGIRRYKETLKRSKYFDKLVKWFKTNFPDEKLYCEGEEL